MPSTINLLSQDPPHATAGRPGFDPGFATVIGPAPLRPRQSTLRARTGAERPAYFYGGAEQRQCNPTLDRIAPLTDRVFLDVIDWGGPLDAIQYPPAGSTRRYGSEDNPFISQRTFVR